jgi:hypothetical protein
MTPRLSTEMEVSLKIETFGTERRGREGGNISSEGETYFLREY